MASSFAGVADVPTTVGFFIPGIFDIDFGTRTIFYWLVNLIIIISHR